MRHVFSHLIAPSDALDHFLLPLAPLHSHKNLAWCNSAQIKTRKKRPSQLIGSSSWLELVASEWEREAIILLSLNTRFRGQLRVARGQEIVIIWDDSALKQAWQMLHICTCRHKSRIQSYRQYYCCRVPQKKSMSRCGILFLSFIDACPDSGGEKRDSRVRGCAVSMVRTAGWRAIGGSQVLTQKWLVCASVHPNTCTSTL